MGGGLQGSPGHDPVYVYWMSFSRLAAAGLRSLITEVTIRYDQPGEDAMTRETKARAPGWCNAKEFTINKWCANLIDEDRTINGQKCEDVSAAVDDLAITLLHEYLHLVYYRHDPTLMFAEHHGRIPQDLAKCGLFHYGMSPDARTDYATCQ